MDDPDTLSIRIIACSADIFRYWAAPRCPQQSPGAAARSGIEVLDVDAFDPAAQVAFDPETADDDLVRHPPHLASTPADITAALPRSIR